LFSECDHVAARNHDLGRLNGVAIDVGAELAPLSRWLAGVIGQADVCEVGGSARRRHRELHLPAARPPGGQRHRSHRVGSVEKNHLERVGDAGVQHPVGHIERRRVSGQEVSCGLEDVVDLLVER